MRRSKRNRNLTLGAGEILSFEYNPQKCVFLSDEKAEVSHILANMAPSIFPISGFSLS